MTPAQALTLAQELHGDQVDVLGEDYVDGHLTRVQRGVLYYRDGVLAEAAALYHVLDATTATTELLLERGVTPEAILVVEEVSRRPDEHGDEGYTRLVARIGQSGSLRAVRLLLAVLEDNLRPLPAKQAEKVVSQLPRYRRAYEALLARKLALGRLARGIPTPAKGDG